jgi:hypothetical protein
VRDVAQGNPCATTAVLVTGQRQRPQRHTVETAHQAPDVIALFHLARQLQGRFDGIGSGRPRKHHFVIQAARLKHFFLKKAQKLRFGRRHHVERVQNAVVLQIRHQLVLDVVVVVTVVDRSCSAEKVDVLLAVHIGHHRSFGLGKYRWKRAAIRTNLRFVGFKYFSLLHPELLISLW